MGIYATGDFKNTERFLKRAKKLTPIDILNKYGREGVRALSSATPKDTGETASSWDYNIVEKKGGYILEWTNSNVTNSTPVAILIQHGHGTNNGGYVRGRDYINPSLRPIFDKIIDEAWKEVRR